MDQAQLNWLTNFIWNIADDVLRDVYVRGKYRDVILPMTVLRRLDAVLEPTKKTVLEMKAALDKEGVTNQDDALRAAAGQAFYNTGIATYVWVLTNRKPEPRRGKVQLIDATTWFRPLRKNMGKKNCELAPEDIQRICDTFLAFEKTPQSKIFPNAAFGYWKVKVERPLRLHSQLTRPRIETLRFASGDEEIRAALYDQLGDDLFDKPATVRPALEKLLSDWSDPSDESDSSDEEDPQKGLPEKTKKKLLDPETWKRDAGLVETATKLREALGDGLYKDHNVFLEQVEATLEKQNLKPSTADLKLIVAAVSWRDETAAPVIKKVHKPGKSGSATSMKPDPLRGLFALPSTSGRGAGGEGAPRLVEFEPDSELRDYEQIPLLEPGGIEAFIRREVLPYTPDLPAAHPLPGQYCVYVLECADGSFYKGQTSDLPKRLKQHENGEVSWTAKHLPVTPIHWEVFETREAAVAREHFLKSGKGCEWLQQQFESKKLKSFERQAGAWIVEADTKIGYEVSFTRHFYQPPKLRTLAEISADILALEQETEGLLSEITKGAME